MRLELEAERLSSAVFMRRRQPAGDRAVPHEQAFDPTELIVYGPDREPRARVTMRDGGGGTVYRVTPRGDRPEWGYPLGQVAEVIAYVRALALDYNVPKPPTTPPPTGGAL